MRILTFLPILLVLSLSEVHAVQSNETIRLSLDEFLEKGIEVSSLMDAEYQNVELAENRHRQARNQRFLPRIQLTTAHGFVPGLNSPEGRSDGSLYLDPDLENDWETWGMFNQGEISALQPVITWGGISNAIDAAKSGAEAVKYEYSAGEAEYRLQLFELYQSMLLAMEMQRLLEDAREVLEEAEEQLEELREEGDDTFTEADMYKFRIFRQEFSTREQEVIRSLEFVENAWDIALDADETVTYLPQEDFLDPIDVTLRDLNEYLHLASAERSELRGLEKAEEAARYGVEAQKAERYPSLVIGLDARAAYTPNRPRQTNPFIRNNTNYLTASFGVGFQQNLNFRTVNMNVERREAERRQVEYQREAAEDGIRLELSEVYRDLQIAESDMENTRQAVTISNEWLREEQIDYDLGFGDMENLVDAVRENLELEVEYRQSVHRYNMKLAELYRKAGLPLMEL